MRLYFIKTPYIFKKILPNYKWSFSKKEKSIYLTFDDGPIPIVTEFVLDTLKEHKAKATFFCVGENIDKHTSIFKRIIKEGHSIGNHTYNHINGWKENLSDYIDNTLKTEKTINNSHKDFTRQKLFRPPYGRIQHKQGKKLKKLGFEVIMWDVLSGDFDKSISKEKCLENVLNNVKNGSIIVFHDSIKAKRNLEYALPITLSSLSKKGFRFKSI